MLNTENRSRFSRAGSPLIFYFGAVEAGAEASARVGPLLPSKLGCLLPGAVPNIVVSGDARDFSLMDCRICGVLQLQGPASGLPLDVFEKFFREGIFSFDTVAVQSEVVLRVRNVCAGSRLLCIALVPLVFE